MIDGLKPYPAYKDSGIACVGQVPEHWELVRLKQWLKVNGRTLPEDMSPDYEFHYLDIGAVGTGILLEKPSKTRFGVAPSRARRVVARGDTIVSTVRTYLKAVYHILDDSGDLVCSTGFAVLTPKAGTEPEFVSYLAQSDPFTDRVNSASVGIAYPAIAEGKLGSFKVAIPPACEQSSIVRFLDHADRRIRRYIRAKKKLIALLEEQKQAIIHRAVTRGLDPNVRLKPSGVEWLGDVPEHWDVVPNRALLRLEKRPVGNAWGDYLLLSLTKRGVIPRDMENPEGKFPTSFDTYQEINPGDLVFCLFDIDETPRAVGLSTLHGMITGAYTRFLCEPSAVGWVHLLYLAMDNGKRLKPLYTGLRKVITKAAFLSAKMPLPSASERAAILSHVEGSTRAAEETSDRAQREISLLCEYRTRLIADVVTGKLDVREAAAKLPDEPEADLSEDEAEAGDAEETANLDAPFEEEEANV